MKLFHDLEIMQKMIANEDYSFANLTEPKTKERALAYYEGYWQAIEMTISNYSFYEINEGK